MIRGLWCSSHEMFLSLACSCHCWPVVKFVLQAHLVHLRSFSFHLQLVVELVVVELFLCLFMFFTSSFVDWPFVVCLWVLFHVSCRFAFGRWYKMVCLVVLIGIIMLFAVLRVHRLTLVVKSRVDSHKHICLWRVGDVVCRVYGRIMGVGIWECTLWFGKYQKNTIVSGL